MAKRTCPGCSREYIGRSTRAIVHGETRLVCSKCAASAIKIVTTRQPNQCERTGCGHEARYCLAHYVAQGQRQLVHDMGPIVKAIRKRSVVYVASGVAGADHIEGVVEGLEMAAKMIESGHYATKEPA